MRTASLANKSHGYEEYGIHVSHSKNNDCLLSERVISNQQLISVRRLNARISAAQQRIEMFYKSNCKSFHALHEHTNNSRKKIL